MHRVLLSADECILSKEGDREVWRSVEAFLGLVWLVGNIVAERHVGEAKSALLGRYHSTSALLCPFSPSSLDTKRSVNIFHWASSTAKCSLEEMAGYDLRNAHLLSMTTICTASYVFGNSEAQVC